MSKLGHEFIEYVKSKAKLNSDGCWLIWVRANKKRGIHVANFNSKKYPLRRGVLAASGLLDMDDRSKVVVLNEKVCSNPNCTAPDHLMIRSTKAHMRHISAGKIVGVSTRVKLQHAKRNGSPLTQAIVNEGRGSGMTAVQLAEKYGTSVANWMDILAGRSWADYFNPYSQLEAKTRNLAHGNSKFSWEMVCNIRAGKITKDDALALGMSKNVYYDIKARRTRLDR
jgi:hypothetical protein